MVSETHKAMKTQEKENEILRRSIRQRRLQEEKEALLINYDDESDTDLMIPSNNKFFIHGFHGLQSQMGTPSVCLNLLISFMFQIWINIILQYSFYVGKNIL